SGTPQSTTVNTAFGTTMTATVLDQFSNVVPGASVTFTAPASAASGAFSNATNTIAVATNVSGVASAGSFTANITAGSYSVTASVTGVVTPASFSLTNTAAAPNSISATIPTPQTATLNTAFGTTMTGTVLDQYGNLVP